VPIDRKNQIGFALRNLFAGKAETEGPSAHLGYFRQHTDIINLFADLEYSSGGIWAVHPGIEWMFARGVIRPRLGWGFHDNGGIDTVATGLGIYVSPVQIDITYLVPTKSLNDNAGVFKASLSYKFGRPQFSEIYYDKALEQANQLDQSVLNMTVKEAELKASLAEAEQKKRLAEEDLRAMKVRIEKLKNEDLLGERDALIKDLKARIHELESRLAAQRSENSELRTKKATVRTHVVAPGDTLQSLAREYYGDPNQWKRIYNANTEKIERGLPRAGEKLVIP
jgi:LysM repeat protein